MPNAPLRAAVTAQAGAGAVAPTPSVGVPAPTAAPEVAEEPIRRRAIRYAWALLLARIYEAFPLLYPKCGSEMRPAGSTLGVQITAFVTEAVAVRDILAHLGEATAPPRMMPARGPPLWEMPDAGQDENAPQVHPAPDYEFDQRIAW